MSALSPAISTDAPEKVSPVKDWTNIVFLTLSPLIGIVGTALYTWRVGFEPWMLTLCLGLYLLVGLSICAGYHRYFAHKSYECSRLVQVLYAVFGAMAAQNSILVWSAGHRLHHGHVDEDWDPYNIRRGFWWAHILWVFYVDPAQGDTRMIPDLLRNPVARWQHRWYRALLLVGGFGIPTAVGALCGDAVAGMLWGGFLRIVVTHHATFSVNSMAHSFGAAVYDGSTSARDNWLVALLSFGEGYHSFHHRFAGDYRNGIRWYQWDPAKWFIRLLELFGLAWRLRWTGAPRIEQARMEAALAPLQRSLEGAPASLAREVQLRLGRARAALERAFELGRQEAGVARTERREASHCLRWARREWREAVALLQGPQCESAD
jgi:stearoyl-CoA desaturase (delta-9 desaturase)